MIPRVIHFIWIYAGQHPTEQHLFSIKTAVLNTTCKIILHTDDRTIKSIPGVEIRYRTFNKEIKGIPFDPDEKLKTAGAGKRVAHISDIVRCEILYEEGGIYSDMDCIWLRNPWEYWDKKVVIGFTNKSYKILANSILMAEPKQPAIKAYHDWLLEIYPVKEYWIPANPYKLWKDRPEVTMVDKHVFFPVKWQDAKSLDVKNAERSIAVHEFASMGARQKGPLVELLEKDYARYVACSRPTGKTRRIKK